MLCKIEHTNPLAIPGFLCRACHPELIPTAEEIAKWNEDARVRRDQEITRDRLARDIYRAKVDIAALTKLGEPVKEPAKGILASIRKKVDRLELEELML